MTFRMSLVAAPALVLSLVALSGCGHVVDDAGSAVTAMNPLTGEEKSYPSDDAVPSGWVVCDGTCPPPVNCGELDEAVCLVRTDCAPLYSAAGVFASCVEAAETCQPEECGPPLGAPTLMCEDGSLGGNTGRCLRSGDGACGWEMRTCPEDACQPSDCGDPMPGIPNWQCSDGTTGGPVCSGTPDGCGWVIRQCPEDQCTDAECGPNPFGAPNYQCSDGTLGGPACERTDGTCGWLIRDCP